MQQIVIPGTQLRVSRFIFGTASLFNAGGTAQRRRLLDAAADGGFTHFDTAPYYGFGMAERDLAPLLARRSEVTVTTKVGLYSPGGERQPGWAVFARKAAGRFVSTVSRPMVDWSVRRARGALDASLRRLGRERVDLYTLHEPDLPLLQAEEWRRWLEDEQTAGRVRAFGIAVEASRVAPFLEAGSPLAGVVQTTDSVKGREADVLLRHGRPLQITYGYVTDALRRNAQANVPAILREALRRNARGAVIVSTRKPERVGQYAALADEAGA